MEGTGCLFRDFITGTFFLLNETFFIADRSGESSFLKKVLH